MIKNNSKMHLHVLNDNKTDNNNNYNEIYNNNDNTDRKKVPLTIKGPVLKSFADL